MSENNLSEKFKLAVENIKTIKDVDVSWKNWQTISINITERKPHSVWCGNDIKIVDTTCYFVDKEGYIYSQAPIFSGTMFTKSYGPLIYNQIPNLDKTQVIGNYFLPSETYVQIFNLIQMLDQNNRKVISLSCDGADYKFILEQGPVIIFNNKNNFLLSFQNLFSAISTKNLDLDKDAGKINYIDLRFDNKIVVGKK